jgi:hypothetical protein
MDQETALPVDFDTYHANIIEANKNDRPDWKIHSNHRDYFGMKDLSPASFLEVGNNMLHNETEALRYKTF